MNRIKTILLVVFLSLDLLSMKAQEKALLSEENPIREENPFDAVQAIDTETQEDYSNTLRFIEIQEKMDSFFEEINDMEENFSKPFQISKEQRLSPSFMKHLSDLLKSSERKLKSFDLRWNIFYQMQQQDIAADEELVAMVEDLNTIKQSVEDSLASRQLILQGVRDFTAAEKFLSDQDTVYKLLGKKAIQLSLTSKTAPQLENLKAKEQIIFNDIQTHYDAARQGAQLFKVSSQEMDNLDNSFISLKSKSAKIQEMAYKPFIQRIKDYLIGLAAVAIIIMFVNMVISKIKAAKKMRENLKKYQETLNQNNNNDIPSI